MRLRDDEAGNHILWRVQAKRAGKRLLSVTTEGELDRYAISQNGPIFLDHRLGDGVTGYEVAERLHAKGYRNLFLTTGDKADTLPTVPHIREIVGKGFPVGLV